jgi:hypothetical protein
MVLLSTCHGNAKMHFHASGVVTGLDLCAIEQENGPLRVSLRLALKLGSSCLDQAVGSHG